MTFNPSTWKFPKAAPRPVTNPGAVPADQPLAESFAGAPGPPAPTGTPPPTPAPTAVDPGPSLKTPAGTGRLGSPDGNGGTYASLGGATSDDGTTGGSSTVSSGAPGWSDGTGTR